MEENHGDERKIKVLVIGAHPDDGDVRCGGVAIKYAQAGHEVVFLSTTNGDTGHYAIGGIELARRRYRESQKAAEVAGLSEYRVFDNHSGELEPTVANRKVLIRTIREVNPDLIITHRPNDYHPDHRYTAQLVHDASYIVSVPNMVALTDINPGIPRIFYMSDEFDKPNPFQADIVVGIDEVVEQKVEMMACHESQMFEWLPFNRGVLSQVPKSHESRRDWLRTTRMPLFERIANRYRDKLIELYGAERGQAVRYAEAFELCQYGSAFDPRETDRLFPFFDAG